jgi:hypothetical protein
LTDRRFHPVFALDNHSIISLAIPTLNRAVYCRDPALLVDQVKDYRTGWIMRGMVTDIVPLEAVGQNGYMKATIVLVDPKGRQVAIQFWTGPRDSRANAAAIRTLTAEATVGQTFDISGLIRQPIRKDWWEPGQ